MTGHGDPGQIFREESVELLADLEAALLRLEQRPTDRDPLDTAFRALHTIKGSGAMFGFEAAASFTHHLESAFDRMRRGELSATPALIGIALAAKDHIRILIDDPANADAATGERLLARLAEQSVASAGAAQPAENAAEEPVSWRIRFRLAPDALERGTNPLLLLDELQGLGKAEIVALTDTVPPLEELEPTRCHIGWDLVLTTTHPRSTIEDVFIFVIDETELTIEPVAGPAGVSAPNPAATPASLLPAKPAATAEERGGTGPAAIPAATPAAAPVIVPAKAQPAANSIRVPAERLDDLMDQVGELVIAHARLKQLIADSLDLQIKSVTEEIERLSNGLRDITMGIRMVPVGSLFGRFRRLVRDLSQELGKDVQLTLSGEETELDKTMIERLNDPLVHIIRNSLDHGLEPAAERVAAGKPGQGQTPPVRASPCRDPRTDDHPRRRARPGPRPHPRQGGGA